MSCPRAAVVLAVCLAGTGVLANTGSSGRPIGIKNREVLGIILGKTTSKQVLGLLGRAKQSKAAEPGIEKACYVSATGHDTFLEIYYWFDPVGFSISQGTVQTTRLCRPSRLVTPTLSTASGLRLGLTPKQVTAILGEPDSMHGDEFVYWHSVQRPQTALEAAESRRAGGLLGPVNIYDRVEIRFSGSRVVYIGVEHDETI